MKYPLITLTKFGKFRAIVYQTMKRPYLVTGIISYAVIGLIISLYLAKSPRFTSQMDLVLPGTGSSSSVTLDNVGQIVSQTNTPFSGGGFNPRVNYKEMLGSRAVGERAAKDLNMPLSDFGEPKVKLTEQTSIISFSITGATPENAQAKAYALFNSLQSELDNLRIDELSHHDKSIQQVLNQYRARMNSTRNAIVNFQERSIVVSTKQMDLLITSLSGIKERKVYVGADVQNLKAYINQLSNEIGVSPKLAGQAFALQSDVEFRAYIGELQASITQLSEFSSRWGSNHPKVIAQQKRLDFTRKAINNRSTEIFGVEANEIFNSLSLDLTPKRSQLFADLIEAYASQKAKSSMLLELERSINHLGDELKVYSREIVELERLEREFSMAEAVYTSAAARLEANKSDVFASYPVVQMLTKPLYPTNPSSPKKAIAIIAAIAGFLFITLGLMIVCQRNYLIQILLKKD